MMNSRRWMIFAALALVATAVPQGPAVAGAYAQQVGKCMNDSFSSEERATIVRWIFSIMAAHPIVEPLTSVSEKQVDQLNREVAASVNRTLGGPCSKQAADMISYEGANGFVEAFSLVGQFATVSLMSDPKVSARSAGFGNYLDKKILESLVPAAAKAGKSESAPDPATEAPAPSP